MAHWYNTHVNQQWLTIWLVGLGLFLLLVFVTQLRSVLVQAGGEHLWSNIAFASGIIFVARHHRRRQLRGDAHPGVAQPPVRIAHLVNFYSENNELLLLVSMSS